MVCVKPYRGAGCGETAESACTVREGVLVLLSAVVEYDSGKYMEPLGVIESPLEGKGTSNFISDSFLLFRYSRTTS